MHARRDFAEALKALDKNAKAAASQTIAGQALAKIAKMYDIENDLAKLTPEERLRKRNDEIKPLVDDFFAWLKRLMTSGTVLPKLADDNDKGNIDTEKLDPLLPWSDQLPAQCQKKRR